VNKRLRSKRVLIATDSGPVLGPATIVIEGPHIRAVLRDEPLHADDDDLNDLLITPAFVDAHTHLALQFMRGLDARSVRQNLVEDLYFHFESRLSPGDVRAFARLGAYESLLHGVGFVWEHYYRGLELADALTETGLTGVVAPTVQDLFGPGMRDTDGALAESLELNERASLGARGVYAALGPHATDTVSPPLLKRIAALAEEHRLPVHLHVAQSADEVTRVEQREGRTPIALLAREGVLERAPSVLMAHALFATEQDLSGLDPARHAVVFCPSSQAQFAMPAHLPGFERARVRWFVATDCASSNDSLDLQKELRATLLTCSAEATFSQLQADYLRSGGARDARAVSELRRENARAMAPALAPERLLWRITEGPGALHPRVRVGVIAAGALANLVAWDTTHPAFFPGRDVLRALALGSTAPAIQAMWTAGRELGTRGDFARSLVRSEAYREAHAEASRRLALLIARAS
jgi:5-methylthioadenosine/S-adenosylhomocysteine deaminase